MTTRTVEDHVTVDEDTYPGVLRDIEPSEEDGPFGPYLTWTAGILTDDGEVEVEGRTSDRWKGNTKARAWYSAMLGRPLVKGEDIDLDAVIGKPARFVVIVVESNKGIAFNRIDDIKPPKANAPPKVAPAVAEPTVAEPTIAEPTTEAAETADALPF